MKREVEDGPVAERVVEPTRVQLTPDCEPVTAMWPPRSLLTFLLASLVLGTIGVLGCDITPEDTESYEAVDSGAVGPGVNVGKACVTNEQCTEGLACWMPSECRVPEGGVLLGGEGQLPGEVCDATAPCIAGASCQPIAAAPLCSTECSQDSHCPGETACWLGGGSAHGRCVQPGGLVGATCEYETDCAPGLFCENRTAMGYCTRECSGQSPCPAGMGAICTAFAQGNQSHCLQECLPGHKLCSDGSSCRKMALADYYVCEPAI